MVCNETDKDCIMLQCPQVDIHIYSVDNWGLFRPKSIINIRDEVPSIGISETSFTGGLVP